MKIIDSHCHINKILKLYNNDIEYFITKIRENNIKYIINSELNIIDFNKNVKIFNSYNEIFNSYGIHPLNATKNLDFTEFKKNYEENKKIIAIGETGLDFTKGMDEIYNKMQIESFIKHIILSIETNNPLIIHSRMSSKYIIEILKRNKKAKGMIHCFNDDKYVLKKYLDLGFYISISGIVTFKKNTLEEIINYIPLNKILVETDSPYLTPEPYRGKINTPLYIIKILEVISKITKLNIEYLTNIIFNNFKRLFNLN